MNWPKLKQPDRERVSGYLDRAGGIASFVLGPTAHARPATAPVGAAGSLAAGTTTSAADPAAAPSPDVVPVLDEEGARRVHPPPGGAASVLTSTSSPRRRGKGPGHVVQESGFVVSGVMSEVGGIGRYMDPGTAVPRMYVLAPAAVSHQLPRKEDLSTCRRNKKPIIHWFAIGHDLMLLTANLCTTSTCCRYADEESPVRLRGKAPEDNQSMVGEIDRAGGLAAHTSEVPHSPGSGWLAKVSAQFRARKQKHNIFGTV